MFLLWQPSIKAEAMLLEKIPTWNLWEALYGVKHKIDNLTFEVHQSLIHPAQAPPMNQPLIGTMDREFSSPSPINFWTSHNVHTSCQTRYKLQTLQINLHHPIDNQAISWFNHWGEMLLIFEMKLKNLCLRNHNAYSIHTTINHMSKPGCILQA